MPLLSFKPSPTPKVELVRYDAALFPQFNPVFQPLETSSPLIRQFVQDPDQAEGSLILKNVSRKSITAMKYLWLLTDAEGNKRPRTSASDSYRFAGSRPVAPPGSLQLLKPTAAVDENVIDALTGSSQCGFIGGVVSATVRGCAPTVELRFEIQFLMFEDGEISGPDPEGYAAELHYRRSAAQFVAKQIRLAEAEHRDPEPVLAALAALRSVPQPSEHRAASWIANFSHDYLRHSGSRREGLLRNFENMPPLPKFYREAA